MWHRFSVVLAIVVASGVGGWGYLALSPQTVAAPLSPDIESPGVEAPSAEAPAEIEAVASTYVQSQKRSGSGRRRMRGS